VTRGMIGRAQSSGKRQG